MVAFLADENFDNRIIRGLLRRQPNIDVLRVQDTSVSEADDPTVLSFALESKRVLISHDFKTLPDYFKQNMEGRIPNPGVIMVGSALGMKTVIDDLELIGMCSNLEDWEGKIYMLPL